MIVDRAKLADVRAIAEIHVDAWRAAYERILPSDYLASLSVERREAMWQKTVESGQPELLVAREGNTVRGWVAFGACRDKDAPVIQAEVWAIYVAPSAWFKGTGRSLWLRARELMREKGYVTCSLWVSSQNDQAIRFYRSIGFAADDLPPQGLELGGQQLQEVRYVCRIDG
jgi:ribosomal protein S18 acetylase RimI-like enzyme